MKGGMLVQEGSRAMSPRKGFSMVIENHFKFSFILLVDSRKCQQDALETPPGGVAFGQKVDGDGEADWPRRAWRQISSASWSRGPQAPPAPFSSTVTNSKGLTHPPWGHEPHA